MSEEKKEVQDEPKKDEIQDEKHSDLENLDAKELIAIIKETRSEAKTRRIKGNELEAELDKYKAIEQKAKDDDLKKKGEYETLLTNKDAEIDKYKPKAEEWDAYISNKREDIKKELGENWDDDYDSLNLSALEKLSAKLTKTTTTKTTVDNPNNTSKEFENIELTESEKNEAVRRYPNLDKEVAFKLHKESKIKKLKRQKDKEK